MNFLYQRNRPTIGALAGWQFYRTATNLSYLAPIFRGMSRAAQTLGCNLLLGCGIGPSASPKDPLRPAWPVPAYDQDFVPIGPWNTDGLVIAPPLHSRERSDYVQGLQAAGLPVLFIGSGETGPTIVSNNSGGILEAIRHLLDHGHSRIAFIAGSQDDLLGDSGKRLAAFREGCDAFNLEQDPRLLAYGRHVYDGGFAGMQQILTSGAPFTALLASNDESALGAMDALQQAGYRIPDDVAVIGFDNRLEGAFHEPSLTSIHVPLFNIGYRAVELMLQHITGIHELPELVQVDAHLVVRQSCGCKIVKRAKTTSAKVLSSTRAGQHQELARIIAARIQKQAYNLEEAECQELCRHLVDTFAGCIESGDPAEFQQALASILQRTAEGEDDTHIWQDAVTLLEQNLDLGAQPRISELLGDARLAISAQMQRQHREYVLGERWTSSRLSLLTAWLLTSLDEQQIFTVLSKLLPDLHIQTALLGFFEAEDGDPFAWSVIRNTLDLEQEQVRVRSYEFPAGCLSDEHPFILTLIPLIGPSGQLGFTVFDTSQFNLYGFIVQQLGGALNTARLYRQVTEALRMAEEANRMKSRFLSTISHELRTPLNMIVGLSGVMLQESDEGKADLPDSTRKDIERVQAYAQHLGGLIGDVLDLASSGAGQLRLHYNYVDLGQTLQIVADSGSQLALEKGLNWHAEIPERGPWVWGDRTRLRQIVLNLVNNAIKFTTRGEVSLAINSSQGQVTVTVKDTGLGIPPEEQSRIFEEFHRTERSVAGGYPGLGLGLSISKTLVEMHNGVLNLYSLGIPGDGSTFYFTLPEVYPPALQFKPTDQALPAEKSILLLFQSPGVNDRLAVKLDEKGVKLQQAPIERSKEWQAKLKASPPDVIVLDVGRKSDLAWRTMKTIKNIQTAQDIPILFYASTPQGESILNLDYLTKPIEPEELAQVLDQHWKLSDPSQPARTFLIVDDDLSTLELHARIVRLQSTSNRVFTASNGREALKLMLQKKIDLVLLDLQMPDMDGFAVLQAMRESPNTRNIPVIVITGKELTDVDMEHLNEGVAVVLRKGLFTTDETIAHIGAALERKRRLSLDAQRLVRQAMLFIHNHYSEPISRGDIARHINIAEDYLTFCFRQELSTTPIKYLQRYRVNQAKLLLKNTSKSITEIALEVGFTDSGYFSRVFHRETDMPPEVFRRS